MTPSILFVPPKVTFYSKPYIFHILHSYPKPKMAKIIATLFMLSLVLCSATLTYAARPDPKSNVDETTSQHEVVAGRNSLEALIESCHMDGLSEDECLERRTLSAHLDYIYTQGQKDKP